MQVLTFFSLSFLPTYLVSYDVSTYLPTTTCTIAFCLMIFSRLLCRSRDGMPSLSRLPVGPSEWIHVPHLISLPQRNAIPAANIQL